MLYYTNGNKAAPWENATKLELSLVFCGAPNFPGSLQRKQKAFGVHSAMMSITTATSDGWISTGRFALPPKTCQDAFPGLYVLANWVGEQVEERMDDLDARIPSTSLSRV